MAEYATGLALIIQAMIESEGIDQIVDDRIEPFPAAADTARPCIAVSQVDETDDYLLNGSIQYPQTRLSVHCIAQTATGADQLAEVVKRELRDFRGELLNCEVTIYKAGSDYTDFSDDQSTFRRVVDFVVRWRLLPEGT